MVKYTDTQRLDWLICMGAKVNYSSDGEICTVKYSDKEWLYETALYHDAREAIDAAINGNIDRM